MKRGEIWTAAAAGVDYAGKPRPVVIAQDDRFDGTSSITICAFTSDPTDARSSVLPSYRARSVRIGRLADEDLVRLNRAIMIFLGLAG